MNIVQSPGEDDDLNQYIRTLKNWGADFVSHSSTNFLDHLIGTYRIVAYWKLERRVQIAALFHSVYGINTDDGLIRSNVTRTNLADAIGTDAENLVWCLFSLDRENFFSVLDQNGKIEGLETKRLDDLVHLLAANQVEQIPRAPELADLSRIGPMLTLIPYLKPIARAHVMRVLVSRAEKRISMINES